MRIRTSWNVMTDGLGPLGGGVAVPRRFTAIIEGEPLRYRVSLEVVLKDGRLVCERVCSEQTEESGPVTSEGLRRLPIASMVRDAAEDVLMQAQSLGGGETRIVPLGELPEQDGRGPNDEELRHLAAHYRLAYACGMPPTRTVAGRLGLTRSTAGRWVMLARERGFLGPTTSGRAGGVGGQHEGDTGEEDERP